MPDPSRINTRPNNTSALSCSVDVLLNIKAQSLFGFGADVTYTPVMITNFTSVECDPASGSWFPEGTTKVTCIEFDDAQHITDYTFSVVVK